MESPPPIKVSSINKSLGVASLLLAAPVYLIILIFVWSISDFSGNIGGDGAVFIMIFLSPVLAIFLFLGFLSAIVGSIRTRGKNLIAWIGLAANGLILGLALTIIAYMYVNRVPATMPIEQVAPSNR